MKINNIVVTFWFNKVVDIKNKLDIFESELKDFFHGINSIGVPADINPEYPRMTAMSDGGHSKLNISMINLQLMTNFDNFYNENYDLCFDYIEKRVLKLYNILSDKLGLDILYSAIVSICEVDINNPVSLIKKNLLSDKLNNNYCEAGIRMTEIIDNKFYRNIAINSAKQITVTKKMEPGQHELIMPLISMNNSKVEKESLIINYEINDKCSYNNDSNYRLSNDVFLEMLRKTEKDIEQEILKILNIK